MPRTPYNDPEAEEIYNKADVQRLANNDEDLPVVKSPSIAPGSPMVRIPRSKTPSIVPPRTGGPYHPPRR